MSRPDEIIAAFERDCILLPIAAILPVKTLRRTVKASDKYRQITASIREVGIIEPPVVARDPKAMHRRGLPRSSCHSR